MHILLITTNLSGKSGWGRYALDLGKALQRQGHTITACVEQSTDQSWCQEIAFLPPAHHCSNMIVCFFTAKKMKKKLRDIQPDIIHFIAEPYSWMLPFLGKNIAPSCVTVHGTYAALPFMKGFLLRKLVEKSYKLVQKIIVISEFTQSCLFKAATPRYGNAILKQKTVVLTNAIDLSALHYERKERSTPASIMSVGAVKPRKGYLEAIRACAAFKKISSIPFHYNIIGSLEEDSSYIQKLISEISKCDLDDVVHFCGNLDDVELKKAYRDADLFLLLSIHIPPFVEGFGLVFLEANAHGIPVIGPKTGGCPEAIADGKSGFVCDPHNAEEVAKRMEDILARNVIHPDECRTWAEKHAIEYNAEKMLEYYEELLHAINPH
jgi:glycosyltransferase involved in cell wall biosynthesis